MPIISMFYGIIIYMFCERNAQHKKPHLHAEYQDYEIVITLDGEVLAEETYRINKKKCFWLGLRFMKMN